MIADDRGCIEYEESGTGPTIVLVPGSCSTSAAWRPVIAQWAGGFRCVTTSLLGYGRTAERRSPGDAGMLHEVEILEKVIRRARGPVHLVGHSFGGLTALAVALRDEVPLLSLTILEAPALEILPHMGERAHYSAFKGMTDDYRGAFRAGQPDAIELMIDFYGGSGTFRAWPQRVRDYAVATTPVNILDWTGVFCLELTPAVLARIGIPTLVMWGAYSNPAVARANALVGQCIPNAEVGAFAGAAHFMISTHARDVARAIARHVAPREQERQAA